MSSGKSKKFCVEDALTILLDGNQSDIEELDSHDDDDDDEARCANSGFFIEEVDVNDKDDVNDDVIDTDGSCEENDDDNDSVFDDATISEAGKADLQSLMIFRWRKGTFLQ